MEKVNQRFLRTFNAIYNRPYLIEDCMFLFYDCVHVIKSIRKNWLAEKNGWAAIFQ